MGKCGKGEDMELWKLYTQGLGITFNQQCIDQVGGHLKSDSVPEVLTVPPPKKK